MKTGQSHWKLSIVNGGIEFQKSIECSLGAIIQQAWDEWGYKGNMVVILSETSK